MTYLVSLNRRPWHSFPDRVDALALIHRTRRRYPTCLLTLVAS